MLSSLSILILLPLLLANLAFLSRKYQRYHFLISLKIIASALMISIFLPISSKIYQIDFGIIQLKFMSDIYSYLFGILVCVVWLITVLYSYSYNKLTLDRNKIIKFHRYLNLTIFSVFGNGYCGDLKTLFIFYFLMIIFTAPLIISKPAKSSIKAYLLYLKTHLATSLLLFLPAIIILKFCDIDLDFAKKLSTASTTPYPCRLYYRIIYFWDCQKLCFTIPSMDYQNHYCPNPSKRIISLSSSS